MSIFNFSTGHLENELLLINAFRASDTRRGTSSVSINLRAFWTSVYPLRETGLARAREAGLINVFKTLGDPKMKGNVRGTQR